MSRIYGAGILKSMLIAFRNFFRPNITLQYPHEKLELPERSRWAVALKLDEEGKHRCTGCLACEKACPDYIIEIQTTTGEDRSKHIDHWKYEVGACMMCGLCVEACPYDAICMSHQYELARTDPDALCYELLTDVPAASPKRKSAEGAAARPARPVPAEKLAAELTSANDEPIASAGDAPAAAPVASRHGSAPTDTGEATQDEPEDAPDPRGIGEAPLPVDPACTVPGCDEPDTETPAPAQGGDE